jgi:hypothetical protein
MTRLFERLQSEHPGIRLSIAEAQGSEIDVMLDSGAVDLALLFRFMRPSGPEEKLLCMAHTSLVSAPDDELTRGATVKFSQLAGLRIVLPRRPSHWRSALDQTARSLGFRLEPVAEADSLSVQKNLVASHPGLYSVLGPYSFTEELPRSGCRRASAGGLPRIKRAPGQSWGACYHRIEARSISRLEGTSWGIGSMLSLHRSHSLRIDCSRAGSSSAKFVRSLQS